MCAESASFSVLCQTPKLLKNDSIIRRKNTNHIKNRTKLPHNVTLTIHHTHAWIEERLHIPSCFLLPIKRSETRKSNGRTIKVPKNYQKRKHCSNDIVKWTNTGLTANKQSFISIQSTTKIR